MLIEQILTEFKRTHLEHIEDIVVTDGYEGGKAVVEYFSLMQLVMLITTTTNVEGRTGPIAILAQVRLESMFKWCQFWMSSNTTLR